MSPVMKPGETTVKPSAQELEAFFKEHYQLVFPQVAALTV